MDRAAFTATSIIVTTLAMAIMARCLVAGKRRSIIFTETKRTMAPVMWVMHRMRLVVSMLCLVIVVVVRPMVANMAAVVTGS
jgi:hypothetical protein